ncbi:hypothetical protein U9M48_037579 [Paspalum notatum var. saurae]|uniref:TTF-type domain-containing protein n=1 Tax=Paspalum notatum var. saurae TaxID=547442 RepID=A0AAQ3UGQ2_PASNO
MRLKVTKIDSFFKKKDTGDDATVDPGQNESDEWLVAQLDQEEDEEEEEEEEEEIPRQPSPKIRRVDHEGTSVLEVERDPGIRCQIWEYPPDKQDQVVKAYMKHGPYQFVQDVYPPSGSKKHPRRFQAHWFKAFPWLEYSPTKDAAFCFPCFLFHKKPVRRVGSTAFTIKGFKNWKKVNDGTSCAFLTHMGSDGSAHRYSVQCYDNLKNQPCHIEHAVEKQTDEDIRKNRLRLGTSIDAVRWLAFQACPFRGHDESAHSKNQGNFLEMVNLLASYDENVKAVVLGNAPGNAKYTSATIQQEILDLMAFNVQKAIRNEIGDAKFCLIVDESRDESKKEQMALVVRFVDKDGFVREHFLDLIHVNDTYSATLKHELCSVLSFHNLDVKNIRGQGYDGASNMRGEWNSLQAKFLEDCPYAYYVHCFVHQLQLALVGASKEVPEVYNFFEHLATVVNTVLSSSKRNDDLHANQVAEMEHLIELNELETGSGANQIRTLKRPGDTRWSSHYDSVCSLLKLYKPTYLVLKDIATTRGSGTSPSARAKAPGAVKSMMSFDFVFIMHVMRELMGITDLLCKKLQQKSQNIVNAMDDVATTKKLIQNLRDHGWSSLVSDVKTFCNKHGIEIPDMNAYYADYIRSRAKDQLTVEHHYRHDIFTVAVDQQIHELNCRFSEQATELLILCTSLDPKDSFKLLNIDDVCLLASKFYPGDFSEQEINNLRKQLQHYQLVPTNSNFKDLSTVADLCRRLVETGKSEEYYLIDRLIRLVLTLPVSTATTERAFSAMKLVKTRLRNKMGDDFLRDCLVIYIEKEIAIKFTTNRLIDDFYDIKTRRVRLK